MPLHEDGTPIVAVSGGERYEGCVQCDCCKRIWVWTCGLADEELGHWLCDECFAEEL